MANSKKVVPAPPAFMHIFWMYQYMGSKRSYGNGHLVVQYPGAPFLPVEKGELGMRAIRSLTQSFDPDQRLNPKTLLD